MDSLNDETIADIRRRAGLDAKKITRAIQAIREWLDQQPHLPHDIDDGQLEKLFVRCKTSVERSKETLDMYYALKTALPEIFSNRDPTQDWFKRVTNVRTFLPLPQSTEDLDRVTVAALLDPDPDKYSVEDSLKLIFMCADLRLRDDYFMSDILIIDLKNISVQHLAKYTLPIFKKLEACIFKGFNTRVKAVHVINAPQFVDATVNIAKQILKPKIAARIHVHRKGADSLKNSLPVKVLPSEFGGEAGKLRDLWADWVKKMEDNREWFLEQERYKSDETKRPGKSIDSGELFGFQGSFRRLSLD
ncbi:hypothetical protein L9F63_020706 [Diploptera punctata]|uniref:CRAL-TRIO domain-containing protein n=1 Tax=Diploptera punctata TaxID=6984 RepID=A0AAD7ZRR7_DIPPU|nr:hypothetical protein L9F63_020706 [Diploptera punctata]